MASFQKLKNQARREEQRSNWSRAIELYKEAIRLDEEAGSAVDVSLYNRVGDLYLRLGDSDTAVDYYEQAVERYAVHDMPTSAIALCNKILRIAPERSEVYRRLGRLHAQNGLLAEARANFLEYARRRQEADALGDALEALQEFVDLADDEEIRRPFAETLVAAGRTAEAVAQLRIVWEDRRERGSDAREIRQRILELDPGSDPMAGGRSGGGERGPVRSAPETETPGGVGEGGGPPAEAPDVVEDQAPAPAGVPASETEVPPPARPDRTAVPAAAAGAGDEGETEVGELPVHLGRLLASEVHSLHITDAPPTRPGRTSAAEDPGFEELSAILSRFRSQVGEIVEETDYSAHYDLGIAYLSMGLLDAAIAEFQRAIQDPDLLEAAHAKIGECLERKAGRGAGGPAEPAPIFELGDPEAEEIGAAADAAEAEDASTAAEAEDASTTAEADPAAGETAPEPAPAGDGPGPEDLAPPVVDAEDLAAEPTGDSATEMTVPPSAGPGPETTEPPSGPAAVDAEADAGGDEDAEALQELLFEARLAQFRTRMAETEHAIDYHAHFDLGLAYQEIGLLQEAVEQLRVAIGGPRSVATRALNLLEDMVHVAEVPDGEYEVVVSILRILQQHGRAGAALEAALALHERRRAAGAEASALRELIAELDPEALTDDSKAPGGTGAADRAASEPGPGSQTEDAPEAGSAPTSGAAVDSRDELPPAALPELERILSELDGPAAGIELPEARAAAPGPRPAAGGPEAEGAVGDAGTTAFERGLSLLERGERQEAAAAFREALAEFERRRQIRRALDAVARLLELDPEDVVLHHQRAEYAIMANDRTSLVQAYLDLGECLVRQEAPRSARSVYARVLDIDPANRSALQALAELENREVRRESEARARSDEGATAEGTAGGAGAAPGDPDAFDALLSDLRAQGDVPAGPVGDPGSHLELGIAFHRMGMWEEAVRELQQAVRGVAQPLPAFEALGEALWRLGRHGVAVRLLSGALEREATEEERVGVVYWLGRAHEEQGAADAARECYERVCAVDIGHRDAAERLSRPSL